MPGELDKVADQARALREWFRGFLRKHMGRSLTPKATLVFADRTRRRARRWCSMAICGNRAKQAAHRKRLKNKR